MSPRRRAVSRIIKAFLPIILFVRVAVAAVTLWIVRGVTHPPRAPYLVTPQTFSQVTGPILNANDVTWPNHDRTTARGWLIRGPEGAPAAILLHGYGADRSGLLNLAGQLNETTNFPRLRPPGAGKGDNPPVSLGLCGSRERDYAH